MTKHITTKDLGHSAFWSLLNQGLGQILVFMVFLVTARFVSKEAFGIMATSLLAVEIFRQLLIESVGTTFYARNNPTEEDYNAGFLIIFVGGTVSAILLFIFATPLARFLGHVDIAKTLHWISVLLLTTGLSKMHEVWLTKHLHFKILAIRSVTSICIGGGIGIAMAVSGFGILSLIAQQIITAIISLIWLWLATEWRPKFRMHWENIKSIIDFGKFVSLNTTASIFSSQGDVLLSSYYLGPASTGVYNAAKRLLTAIALVINSGLNSVALPALASFSSDKERYRKGYLSCVGYTAIFTAPLFAGLSVLAPDVIQILMGDKWADVAPVLALLAIAGFSQSILQYSTNILLIEKKAHWLTVIGFVDAGVNISLLFIFAKYGLLYLAGAFVAKVLLFSPVITIFALRLLNIKISAFIRKIFTPIVMALIMGLFIHMAHHFIHLNVALNLLLLVPFGAVIYLILFYLLDRKTLYSGIGFFKKTFLKN